MLDILYKKKIPKSFLNMLFFQYWSSFFSSVMIVYSILSYIYIYGTIEWLIINSLNFIKCNSIIYTIYINIFVINFILLFAFLIKIGMTPLHLYKLEIYKGLSYVAIFFYTTFYFLAFFMFFILLIFTYLTSIILYYWYFYFILLIFGILYCISLLFNVSLVKVFFAYSTIVNSMSFICAILSIILI